MANLGYLQLTRDCVQSCRFCSNPPTGVGLHEDEMRAAIDEMAELGYDGIILTGGEPTLSPLLLPALEHARSLGLSCRIITNGQLLCDRPFFERCVAAGLDHLHLSLHSHRPRVHDGITRNPGSLSRMLEILALAPELGVTCDVNTVICSDNAAHLHEIVEHVCTAHEHVRHWVFNGLDPVGNRAEENPDIIPMLHAFDVSLERAMDWLASTGRTFRAERVPLCFMRRHAQASTETRKIIKDEERLIRFLDDKGAVRQQEFLHGKGDACDSCRFDPICAGLYSMDVHYDERELSPVFDDPVPVIEAVAGSSAGPALVERILARRGRRSPTEQPTNEQRQEWLSRPPAWVT